MLFVNFFSVIFLCVFYTVCNGKIITGLPGLESQVSFKQYADYIVVNETHDRRLFYWFIESQSEPQNDPVVLWLNGGPGCSSFGGLLGEMGPFYVLPNTTLGINKYSWNKIANMIFLESPAGVGFSKSNIAQDYVTGDEQTASDSLEFLLNFFKLFPQFKDNEFWITGESYAGHYIPTLTAKIVEHNSKTAENKINLKGLMIGNPLTYLTINNGGVTDYIYSHNLIANETYQGLKKYCNYTFPSDSASGTTYNKAMCDEFSVASTTEMGPLNPYDIYVDVCLQGKSSKDAIALLSSLASSDLPGSVFASQRLRHLEEHAIEQGKLGSPYFPCQESYTSKYLNDPLVQRAIHADPTKWTDCNDFINQKYSRDDFAQSMLPIYKHSILNQGLNVLIYSGDVDSVVPATATRRCIQELGLTIKSKWQHWTDSKKQIGGYTEEYAGLTYATVRNAGHEVPSFQPMRAYDMFSRFLKSNHVVVK
ncbi:uncharacterized protein LOC100177074 [Ciona intestinalis]